MIEGAGVDFSFRSAFRERADAGNLIQTGGRVRRNNEDYIATLIDFKIQSPLYNRPPAFTLASQILERLFEENRIETDSPADLITEALRRELMSDTNEKHQRLIKMEDEMDYPEVANLYKVIASDTRLVIVDKDLIKRLENHEKVNPKEINRKSVQLWLNKINFSIGFVKGYENSGLYACPYDYESQFPWLYVWSFTIVEKRVGRIRNNIGKRVGTICPYPLKPLNNVIL